MGSRVFELAYRVLGFIYNIVAVGHIALGVAVLVGGTNRFPFPSFRPLVELSHGHTWPWGVVILASGTAMLFPNRLANAVGLGVGFLWFNLFSVMFAVAVIRYPGAGATAPVPYAMIGLMHLALLTLKVAEIGDAHRRKAPQWTQRLL